MADFSAHVVQAKSNLDFLESLNAIPGKWDWKVTVSFYVAVHLMNAHLAIKMNKHYRSHHEVETAISPYCSIPTARINASVFPVYMALKNLSRRSRYLCAEDGRNPQVGVLTEDRHLKKALGYLDVLLLWFSSEYTSESFSQKAIKCPLLTQDTTYFAVYKEPTP